MSESVVLKDVVLSYPHLYQMWQYDQTQKMAYSATYIFPEGYDMTLVKEAINAAIVKKWGNAKPANLAYPFKKIEKGEYAGCTAFTAKDYNYKPEVVDQNNRPIGEDEGSVKVFAGCFVNAYVTFYGTTTGGSARVAASLGPIQIVRNDESVTRLGSGPAKAADVFGSIPGAPQATAPVNDFEADFLS